MKPVTIVGGGLAGLSLGISLRKHGVPVTLVEAGHYPRHRVCGEFISGVSEGTLESLGIAEHFQSVVRNQTTAWFLKDRFAYERSLPEPAWGVSRFKLDAVLAEQFESAGGRLHLDTRFSEPDREGLVWASGRQRNAKSDWIGLKCHVRGLETRAELEMHLGDGGYLGFARIEDGRVNACGLFHRRPGIRAKRDAILTEYLRQSGLGELAGRMEAAEIVTDTCLGVSAFQLGEQEAAPDDDGRFRIGDQFAIIGPFTGNGMSMAFESAAIATEVLLPYSRGEQSWEETGGAIQSRLKSAFRKRLRLAGWLHPFLTESPAQKMLYALSQSHLLPFGLLYRMLR